MYPLSLPAQYRKEVLPNLGWASGSTCDRPLWNLYLAAEALRHDQSGKPSSADCPDPSPFSISLYFQF